MSTLFLIGRIRLWCMLVCMSTYVGQRCSEMRLFEVQTRAELISGLFINANYLLFKLHEFKKIVFNVFKLNLIKRATGSRPVVPQGHKLGSIPTRGNIIFI